MLAFSAMMFRCLLPLSLCGLALSFSPSRMPRSRSANARSLSLLFATNDEPSRPSPAIYKRQEFLSILTTSFIAVATSTAAPPLSHAAATSAIGDSWGLTPERPVAVLGASGRTGMEVLQVLAKEGLYSVSMTRTGVDPFRVVKLPAATKAYITHYDQAVNVVNIDSLQQAMDAAQPSAVIFCASASKQGGSAFQVDGDGVGNAALVAKKLGARLIVVSAMAVDRPESKSYQVTNTLGGNLNGIMDAKRQGEQKVRSTLNDYVIVRPGVLMGGKSTQGGVAAVQVNQGDTIGGGLSRDELAGVVVGALQSGTKGATVEVYRKSTATKLQPEFSVPSGLESSSDTYKGLFASVTADN